MTKYRIQPGDVITLHPNSSDTLLWNPDSWNPSIPGDTIKLTKIVQGDVFTVIGSTAAGGLILLDRHNQIVAVNNLPLKWRKLNDER